MRRCFRNLPESIAEDDAPRLEGWAKSSSVISQPQAAVWICVAAAQRCPGWKIADGNELLRDGIEGKPYIRDRASTYTFNSADHQSLLHFARLLRETIFISDADHGRPQRLRLYSRKPYSQDCTILVNDKIRHDGSRTRNHQMSSTRC